MDNIDKTSELLKSVVKKTPLEYNHRLSEKYSCGVYLKREDLQIVRSFKIRGAYNKIYKIKNKNSIVVCASAGNHAQGVAYSCLKLGIRGVIFMPNNTPLQKQDRVKFFAKSMAEVRLAGENFDECYKVASEYCKKNSAIFVHPFDDQDVIEGQATVAKEILDEGVDIDYVAVPIGGGGLIAGVSTFIKSKNGGIKVIGVEAKGSASMNLSLDNNRVSTIDKVDTFADGVAVKTPGTLTFEYCRNNIDEVVISDEGEIANNIIELYQNEGIVTEPAGALSLSFLEYQKDKIKGKNVVCVISGGNNDLLRYSEILNRALFWKGQVGYFVINFSQSPGQLKNLLNKCMDQSDDIIKFEYSRKNNKNKDLAFIGIQFNSVINLNQFSNNLELNNIEYQKISDDDMLFKFLT